MFAQKNKIGIIFLILILFHTTTTPSYLQKVISNIQRKNVYMATGIIAMLGVALIIKRYYNNDKQESEVSEKQSKYQCVSKKRLTKTLASSKLSHKFPFDSKDYQEELKKNNDDKNLVEINGEKKYMLGHILKAQFDFTDKKENPFIHTDVFTFDEDKGFSVKGTVVSVSESLLEQVKNNNFVYTPFYTMKKAGSNNYKNFGAIIVGTKDKSLAKKIHIAFLRNMIAT